MRQLMIAFIVLATVSFSNTIQAQTTCTPAQKEACKKICEANQAKCTPEQIAACKKICNGKATSATAVAINQSPAETSAKCGAAPASAEKTTETGANSLVKLASLPTATEVKDKKEGKKCNPASCVKKKEE